MINRLLATLRRLRYPGSMAYWEKRYASGGHSGAGSAGPLAAFKAAWLNRFVSEHQIHSVLELGCGDGRQLQLADYPAYTGLDIAPTAVQICRNLFASDPSKSFEQYQPGNPFPYRAELAISLEVIFHLTENRIYEQYLSDLFQAATRYVVIFSSNEAFNTAFPHVKSRRFTPDIERIAPDWQLMEHHSRPMPDLSFSDFFVYQRIET